MRITLIRSEPHFPKLASTRAFWLAIAGCHSLNVISISARRKLQVCDDVQFFLHNHFALRVDWKGWDLDDFMRSKSLKYGCKIFDMDVDFDP